jgi:hypothetical protein
VASATRMSLGSRSSDGGLILNIQVYEIEPATIHMAVFHMSGFGEDVSKKVLADAIPFTVDLLVSRPQLLHEEVCH